MIVLGIGEDSADPIIEIAARDNRMDIVGCGNDFVWPIEVYSETGSVVMGAPASLKALFAKNSTSVKTHHGMG